MWSWENLLTKGIGITHKAMGVASMLYHFRAKAARGSRGRDAEMN